MGAGVVTCFTWVPKSDVEEKDQQPDLAVHVVLPNGLADVNVKPTTDCFRLFARASNSTTGNTMHQLPIFLLKRLLLMLLSEKRRDLSQHQKVDDMDSETVLVVPVTRPCTPLRLYITSSNIKQHVQAIFEISKPVVMVESLVSLSLRLCARCGDATGCDCGWRKVHTIGPQMERFSVLEFISSYLPQLPPSRTPSCFNLCLEQRRRENIASFGVRILGHKVQRPMVECPYTVFKINLHVGDLTWRIARRYRAFAELHARLRMVVHDHDLPQLPPATWLAVTDQHFLLRRQHQLENYLKGVFMVDELQDAVPLLLFLGVLSTSYIDHVALRRNRRQILHLQVLEFYTRPGDLILFNGQAKVSGLQRSMTRSEWDHVAIVVPPCDGENLQLLEATGDGVTLTPLTTRLLAYSTFHVRYFALRKLHTPLLSRAVVNDLLLRFTSEVEGLPYGLSIRRILHAKQAEQSRSRSSTFFCSELVAEAYQSLGLISNSIRANDFWPGSFSPGDFVDVELARHGASLSPEIIIDCQLLEVATAIYRPQQLYTS